MSQRVQIWWSFKFGKGDYVGDHSKEIWNINDVREEERKESEVIQKILPFVFRVLFFNQTHKSCHLIGDAWKRKKKERKINHRCHRQ